MASEDLKPEQQLVLKFSGEALKAMTEGSHLMLFTLKPVGVNEGQAVVQVREVVKVWRASLRVRDWVAMARPGAHGEWYCHLLVVGKQVTRSTAPKLPLPGKVRLADVRQMKQMRAILDIYQHAPGRVCFNAAYRHGVTK